MGWTLRAGMQPEPGGEGKEAALQRLKDLRCAGHGARRQREERPRMTSVCLARGQGCLVP